MLTSVNKDKKGRIGTMDNKERMDKDTKKGIKGSPFDIVKLPMKRHTANRLLMFKSYGESYDVIVNNLCDYFRETSGIIEKLKKLGMPGETLEQTIERLGEKEKVP